MVCPVLGVMKLSFIEVGKLLDFYHNSGAGRQIKVVGFKIDIWRLPILDNGWWVSEVYPNGKFRPR